jgi:hypothetical protein
MQLTDEQLQAITDAAYKGFTVEQVAHLIGVSRKDFTFLFSDDSQAVVIAYLKGVYQMQSDLRTAIISSAISGSSPAQAEMKKHLDAAIASLKFYNGNA